MTAMTIDLNADLGEDPKACMLDDDLMRSITSANIACGGHAGDSESVRRAVAAATSLGVNVGAHPSYPDFANFGRKAMDMPAPELRRTLENQIRMVADAAAQCGAHITHVKPHGALYHAISLDAEVAQSLADAVCTVDRSLIVVIQYGSPATTVFRAQGLLTATEAFADRTYEANGGLRSRLLPDALLEEEHAIAQALSIALSHRVAAGDGSLLTVAPDTLCLHSDTPNAVMMAKRLRGALEQAGVLIKPLHKVI